MTAGWRVEAGETAVMVIVVTAEMAVMATVRVSLVVRLRSHRRRRRRRRRRRVRPPRRTRPRLVHHRMPKMNRRIDAHLHFREGVEALGIRRRLHLSRRVARKTSAPEQRTHLCPHRGRVKVKDERGERERDVTWIWLQQQPHHPSLSPNQRSLKTDAISSFFSQSVFEINMRKV